jgi:hypothetical protein
MTEAEVVRWIRASAADVDETINDGNRFFFSNPPGFEPEHLLPFATIVTNYHYDDGSDLDRPGVYRLNIGISRQTFEAMFPADAADAAAAAAVTDRTTLDRFFPHPDYASMFWLSVLNPALTWPRAQELLAEAHAIAKRRMDRKHSHAATSSEGR